MTCTELLFTIRTRLLRHTTHQRNRLCRQIQNSKRYLQNQVTITPTSKATKTTTGTCLTTIKCLCSIQKTIHKKYWTKNSWNNVTEATETLVPTFFYTEKLHLANGVKSKSLKPFLTKFPLKSSREKHKKRIRSLTSKIPKTSEVGPQAPQTKLKINETKKLKKNKKKRVTRPKFSLRHLPNRHM